jgi:hypothetical protein
MEQDSSMRTKSIDSILGLNVHGTLMRMDENGLCHITIAHSDPDYCDRAIKYLQKLHIQGKKLDWEGDVIELTSIRLTQRNHPSKETVLQVDDQLQFPPLSGNSTLAKKAPPEPEIEIGNSEGSCASSDTSSNDDSVTTDMKEHHIETPRSANDTTVVYEDLVDTDDEELADNQELPKPSSSGQLLISDYVTSLASSKIPHAPYPPFQHTDTIIDNLTQLCDAPVVTDSPTKTGTRKLNNNEEPSPADKNNRTLAVSFRKADELSDRESASHSTSSSKSLVSPTLSRDSTVVDMDTGVATVFQKQSTAATMAEDNGLWEYKATRQSKHYDQNNRDEALEEAIDTEEDDMNTISSDQTSHYKNLDEANKEEPPPSIRYQLGFQIDDEDLTTLLQDFADQEDDNDNLPDTLSKTKALVTSFFNQAKSLDAGFAIVSWADASTFELITSSKDIPSDTVTFASFFKGFRPKQVNGRMYLRVRLHAPTIGQGALSHGMTEWSRLSGCTFYKTVIQAENATAIGWFVYSSQHTNLDSLTSHLAVKTGYEWGCKLGACTASDSMTTDEDTNEPIRAQWKDRVKALFIYVPHEKAMEAKTVISDLMEINSTTAVKTIPSLSEKFLFMHPERQMSDEPSKLYYQQIVTKQTSHVKHIQINIANIFDQPIDQPILTRDGGYISLRQLVLSLRVTNKLSEFFNASLFHGLDYTEDSGKVYFNGQPGPGGPAYIFSYYAPMAADAEEMLQGLGIYAGRIYGNTVMNPCFTTSHWNGNKGWKWDKISGCFLTPASRQREANLNFDPNLAIEKLAKMDSLAIAPKEAPVPALKPVDKKPKSKKKRGRKSKKKQTTEEKDDDSATHIEHLKVKETTLLTRVMDHENDSQIQGNSAGHVKKKAVSQVIIPSHDDVSIASTLTMGSIVENNATVLDDNGNTSPSGSMNSKVTSTSSLKSVANPEYFSSLLNEGMTPDEIRERAETFYKHQVNKAHINHQRALESFLSTLPDTNTQVVTPHKPQLSGGLSAGHTP